MNLLLFYDSNHLENIFQLSRETSPQSAVTRMQFRNTFSAQNRRFLFSRNKFPFNRSRKVFRVNMKAEGKSAEPKEQTCYRFYMLPTSGTQSHQNNKNNNNV
jgi:hypothetical protein